LIVLEMVSIFFLSFFLSALGFEFRTSWLLGKCSYHLSHLLVEIGSCKLHVQTDLKLWSSQSQPSKKLGLQVWATGVQLSMVNFLRNCQTLFFL
jgi:hypothetical protein